MAQDDDSPADVRTGKTVRIQVDAARTRGESLSSGTKYNLSFARPQRWIELCLLDAEGKPCAEQAYAIHTPDGTCIAEGVLDADGKARVETIKVRKVCVRYPGLVAGSVVLGQG